MSVIIPATDLAAPVIIDVGMADKGKALVVKGDLASDVIPLKSQNPDDTWSQIATTADGDLELSATNQSIAIFAAMGKILVDKPSTTNEVEVTWG